MELVFLNSWLTLILRGLECGNKDLYRNMIFLTIAPSVIFLALAMSELGIGMKIMTVLVVGFLSFGCVWRMGRMFKLKESRFGLS